MVYIDGLLVFCKYEESHNKYLKISIEWLQDNQLYASPEICERFKKKTDLLDVTFGKPVVEMGRS